MATRRRFTWYVNDTWRVSQHLSLNAGVRYEYTTTPIGENRQTLNAISDTPSILVPQAGNQPLVFGKIQPPKTIGRLASVLRIHREAVGIRQSGLALAWLTTLFTTT